MGMTVTAAKTERWRGGGASREHRSNPRSVGNIGGVCGGGEPRICAPAPTSVNIARVTGAHQPDAVGRPRSGRESSGPSGRWTRTGGDQPNIPPLDLNFPFKLCTFTLLVSSQISI